MNKPKAVLLFSGGLDSTTVLAHALHQGFDVYPLSFDYGQKHKVELQAAKRVASAFKVSLNTIQLALGTLTGSALTDTDKCVPDFGGAQAIPVTYVPARNTVFLSLALAYAEVLGARDIFVGVSSVDYSGYPDCRPEFIHAFEVLANLATKMAIEGQSIRIHAPLLYLSKAQTIQMGCALQVDYALTISCYRADGEGLACGLCDSCVLRKEGFRVAGILDPTRYAIFNED